MSEHLTGPASAQPAGTPYHRQLWSPSFGWGRAAFGILLVLTGWIAATFLALLPAQLLNPDAEGEVSWSTLLATNVSLAALVPICLLVYQQLFGRPAGRLSSVQPGIRWKPLAIFLGLALLAEVALLGFALLASVDFAAELSGPAGDAAAVITVTLLTSTLQAAGEEYFFRGYLLQTLGALVRNPWFAISITAVVFTLLHGVMPWDSPALFADRFAFGLVAGYLAVRTGGLEASIAVHASNNVVTFVFAALTDSVSGSLQAIDAPWSLVAVDVVKFVLFGAVALRVARWQRMRSQAGDPPVLAADG